MIAQSTAHGGDALFIDGSWRPAASGNRIQVVSPSTEEVIGEVPDAGPDDVDGAVLAARRAFSDGEWRGLSTAERAAVLEQAFELLDRRVGEIAHLVTAEMGLPVSMSTKQVPGSLGLGRFFVDLATREPTVELRPSAMATAAVLKEPVGVVAAISPWNGPFHSLMLKAVPALVTGCSVVYKPSAETPLDGFIFTDALAEAGVPPGVFNFITGDRDAGRALVAHPQVDKVSFTGSTAAGRQIGEECGRSFKRVGLELGGKSAAIVLDDADLDTVAAGIGRGAFSNSGQLCASFSRILVPRSRYAEIADALVSVALSLVTGDPFDPATTTGPLVSSRQQERVMGYIHSGINDGARLLTGGGRPAGQPTGYYVEPTVFGQAHNQMRICREEIFGPVAAMIAYDTVDEAIAIANDSDYGLHGGVFTSDPEAALYVVRRVRTGTITVNGFVYNTAAPFGGVKCSGVGRDTGLEGLNAFYELKTVNITPAMEGLFA